MKTATEAPNQSPNLDEKTWWDFWNKSYRTGDDNGEIPNELFARAAKVVNEVASRGQRRILEVACGTGAFSRLLTFSSYHGLDISPAAIEIARQNSARVLRSVGDSLPTYEAADFHDWPFPSDPFDIAVCIDALVWFRDQRLALTRMAQCLRPGGQLVLVVINPFVYKRIKRTAGNPLKEGTISHWLSRNELYALTKAAGFAIERSYTIMPRGNRGILRLLNARRVDEALGPHVAARFRRLKEHSGLGQYRVLIARKRR